MSGDSTHRRTVPKHKHHAPLKRGGVSGTFPAERSHGLAEALREALEELKDWEAERLHTTRRTNTDDDDEDPTRRGGSQS